MKIRQIAEEQFEELHSVGIFVFADWGDDSMFLPELSAQSINIQTQAKATPEYWKEYGYVNTKRRKARGYVMWKYFALLDEE